MGKFQDWCIETLEVMLNSENFIDETGGYKNAVKNLITHYASMYEIDEGKKAYINIWKTLINEKILISEKAKEILDKSQSKDEKIKDLHWEHITPNEVVYKKLMQLVKNKTVSKERIKDCFAEHKLVLISKKESQHLDGAGEDYKSSGTAKERLKHLQKNNVKYYLFDSKEKEYKEIPWETNEKIPDEITNYLTSDEY